MTTGQPTTSERVLVTGGCGFIGSALVRRLAGAAGVQVLNVDKMTYASQPEAVAEVADTANYRAAQVDICDLPAMQQLFTDFEPDTVIHLAAESHVDRSIDAPESFIQSNIVGTSTLLEAALRFWSGLSADGQRNFRFVQVSTDEVYGTLDLGSERKFALGDPYRPNSPYAASKASADHLVRAWHETYGLPGVVSNCSNNFGPWQFSEKMIPTMILAGLNGDAMPVYGNGANVRDWLYVEDHVDALLTVARHGRPGEQYLVGGANELSNLDLVKKICTALDAEYPGSPFHPHEQLIRFVPDRPGHDLRYAVDSTKIQTELGWRPAWSLEDGLRHTIAWYAANRERYAGTGTRRGVRTSART